MRKPYLTCFEFLDFSINHFNKRIPHWGVSRSRGRFHLFSFFIHPVVHICELASLHIASYWISRESAVVSFVPHVIFLISSLNFLRRSLIVNIYIFGSIFCGTLIKTWIQLIHHSSLNLTKYDFVAYLQYTIPPSNFPSKYLVTFA